jgi:4-amino-4-deoxy-L-arabinose transferase-like glycosyltransferase
MRRTRRYDETMPSGIGGARAARIAVTVSAALTVALSLGIGKIERFRAGAFDEGVYRLHVRNLIDHGFYGYAPGRSIAYRAPGYPFFDAGIRLVNDGQAGVRVAQALLAGLIVLVSARIARRLFGEIAAGITAVLLVAVGTLQTYAAHELSETLATVTLVGAVAAALAAVDRIRAAPIGGAGAPSDERTLTRPDPRAPVIAAASGVLLGLSILTRPQTLLLVAPLGLVVAAAAGWRSARWRAGAFVAVFAIATVLPWTVRNAVRLHAFVPVSTYGGVNFWLANNERADGRFRTAKTDADPFEFRWIIRLGEVEQDHAWYGLAFRFIREHPGRALVNWFHDGWLFLSDDDDFIAPSYVLRDSVRPPRLDDRILWLGGVAGLALAIGPDRGRRRAGVRGDRVRASAPAVVVGYFVLFFMLFLPLARFRHGVIPFLAVYAGLALSVAGSEIARKRPGRGSTRPPRSSARSRPPEEPARPAGPP